VLLLSTLAHAAEVGLTVQPQISVDTRADRDGEDSVEGYTWVRAWAEGREGEARWFIEARALHVLLVGEDTESVASADLGESGVSLPVGPGYLDAGYLVERWGRLDLLPVADVLNGRDLRAGPLTPLAVSRLPTAMAVAELPWSWGRAELAWAPVPGVSRTSVQGTDWSLIRQGMLEGLLADVEGWDTSALGSSSTQSLITAAGGALLDSDPWTRWGQAEALSVSGMPAAFGPNTDVAGRLGLQASRVDGALIAGWLRARQPAIVVDPALVRYIQDETLPGIEDFDEIEDTLSEPYAVLAPSGPVLGAEVGGTVGAIGVRAEALWRRSVAVQQQWLDATESPELSAGLGLDYARGSWLFVTEGSWRRIDQTAAPLLTARDTYRVAGAIQGRLARERLSLQLGGVYDVTFREHLVQPAVGWRASDQLQLQLSGLILGGPSAAPQTFREAMAYGGGPLGYWGDNDSLQASVTWIR